MDRFLHVALEYFKQNAFIGSLAATVLLWGLATLIRNALKKKSDKKVNDVNEKLALERQVLSGVFLPSREQLDMVGGFQHLREFAILHEDDTESEVEASICEDSGETASLTFGYELQGKWNLYCADVFPMSIGCAQTKCQLCLPREMGLRDEHARVTLQDDSYLIQAVSGGEISVDEKAAKGAVTLTNGMKIRLGNCTLLTRISRREG